jgi:peptidoglycan biosynthesis protein MviN/MurJ (putative lipid II flippase)
LYFTLTLSIGTLNIREQVNNLWRLALAAAGMAAVIWGLLHYLPTLDIVYFSNETATARLITLFIVVVGGSGVYFLLAALLRIGDVKMMGSILGSRFKRRRTQR